MDLASGVVMLVGVRLIVSAMRKQPHPSIPPACHMMIMALIFMANEQTSLELNT